MTPRLRPVCAWARLDVRLRRRSLLALTLLVAVSSGVVLATLAGARRTNTAVPRLQAQADDVDVTVLPNRPGFEWEKVRRLPSVEALGLFVLAFASPQASTGSWDEVGLPAGDLAEGRTIDRPVLRRGRYPDPNDPLEALGTDGFLERYGDHVTVRLSSEGPTVRLRIVGEAQDLFQLYKPPPQPPTFQPTFAFFRDYVKPRFPWFANARVRLRGGESAIPRFRRELATVAPTADIEIAGENDRLRSLKHSATFTATGWLCFAVAALIAALLLVGQALARYCAASAMDLQTLQALGLGRREARLAAASGPALAGLTGCLLGCAGALLASPLFPTAQIRPLEPDPGIRPDLLVLVAGGAAMAILTLAGSWWAARPRHIADLTRARRSSVAAAAARTRLGVVAVLGTRFALEPGRGRHRAPVRPALVGAIAGVLGVVGAFTFREGLDEAAGNPARFGQTLAQTIFVGEGTPTPADARALRRAAASPAISVLNDARVEVFTINRRSVTTFSLAPLKGRVDVVALSGRPPESADEIALGPETADALHVGAGDRVRVGTRTLRVSGVTFVPESDHNGYADGAWVSGTGFAALQPDPADDKYNEARFTPAPGASRAAVAEALGSLADRAGPSPVPEQVLDLRNVRVQPLLLGGFLLVLAIGAVGHTLATAVRRRRHELAVLRTLGMTRRQSRLVVATQATVIAAVGLLFGLPLGVAAGRTAWRVLADATPTLYVAPLAVLAAVLAVPGALGIANAIAALPARRAARLRVAETLRIE